MSELIVMIGLPASGKSTIVDQYKDTHTVLSRDVTGGSLNDLEKHLYRYISGTGKGFIDKIILDNTYTTVESRKGVIDIALKAGWEVKCIYLSTSFEDAQYNAVSRMVKRHGRLFKHTSDYKEANDPNMFPTAALYAAKKVITKPTKDEGFTEILTVKFNRKHNGYTNKAILLDYDGTIRITKSGEFFPTDVNDIQILPGRKEKLQEYLDNGYILLGVSNQSGVAKGLLTYEKAGECFEKTNELLGLDIDYKFCSHSVPPIICYCRKPGVGHGVEFIEKYKLDPALCIMVGDMTTDKTFATRCGFTYVDQSKFFA